MTDDDKNIFPLIAQYRDEYTELMLKAFKEGLTAVGEVISSKQYISTYYEFPILSYKDNGLPSLSSQLGSEPKKYSSCFGSKNSERPIQEEELETFNNLLLFVKKHPDLHNRFKYENYPIKNKLMPDIDTFLILSGVKDAIDKYIHKNKTCEYNESKALFIIKQFVSFVFNKKLNIEIFVPLLFMNFDIDDYKLSDKVFIQRISDEIQLSRYKLSSNDISTNKFVVSSATHALVFKGWHVPNPKYIWGFNILYEARAYPLHLIETFFGALRITTDIDTGYAHIFSVAKGWFANSGSTANLPNIQGTTTRSYPDWFENGRWNIDIIPKISTKNLEQLSLIYQQLSNAKENSINLAVKRLNRCLVRDNEEDSVLDATIALEALLLGDGNQEMTHKLAMRAAAITKLSGDFTKSPQQVFKDIKKIYAYRSAIVHGSIKLDKKRLIKTDEEKDVTTVSLAVEYLRILLKVLLENPEYRESVNIDTKLLLGSDE